MTHQVLARKWRPKNLAEIVGQNSAVKALTNSLDSNRLHHAYLFTGTRGVGKTTIARALAKSLNCVEGVKSNPCGKCEACNLIDEGKFVDLIEVDAASRTKVEDTRDLLDNVQYLPTYGRFKIYIIDEVHMLSGHSFNALLKTLEEPPSHVKFILATTDPQKLPVTVLSRCLQFHLRHLTVNEISEHLQKILVKENIEFEVSAIDLIAEKSNGSMRDALSILEQAMAYGINIIGYEDTKSLLGINDSDWIFSLLDKIIEADPGAAIKKVEEIAKVTSDFSAILADMLGVLHNMAICLGIPEFKHDIKIKELCAKTKAEDVQLLYQTALMGQKDLPYAPTSKIGFEMVILRMILFKPLDVRSSAVIPFKKKTEQALNENINKTINDTKNIHINENNIKNRGRENLSKARESLNVNKLPVVENKVDLNNFKNQELNKTLKEGHKNNADNKNIINKENENEQDLVSLHVANVIKSVTNLREKANAAAIINTSTSKSYEEETKEQEREKAKDQVRAQIKDAPSEIKELDWALIVKNLELKGLVKSIAEHSTIIKADAKSIELMLDDAHAPLLNKRHIDKIEEQICSYLGRNIKLGISTGKISDDIETPAKQNIRITDEINQEAKEKIMNDEHVKSLLQNFDASIEEVTVVDK